MSNKKGPAVDAAGGDGVRIFSATWVLPIVSDPIHKGAVAVEGDSIKAVGRADEVIAAYPGAEVTDFHHTIVMPGFVNCHSHMEYAVFRGLMDNKNFGPWILEFLDHKSKLSYDDYVVSAMLGASECVSSGLTTSADSMYSGASLGAIGQAGLRARAYQEVFGLDDNKLGETMSQLEDKLNELEEDSSGLIEIGIAPHATYTVSASLYRAIAEFARERGMKITTHLAESRAESIYIRSGSGILALDFREKVGWDYLSHEPFGVTPVKYLQQWNVFGPGFLAAHCVHVAPADVEALARYDVAIAHCPKSNAKLGCGIAPLPAFLQAGIRVGFGTDSPASSNIMDMFGEMRTAIFLHRGVERDAAVLGAAECVQMATLGGARALGMEDRIGSLEPGKQADIIAVDMEYSHFTPIHDPYSALVFGANQEDVFFTMVAGRLLYTRKVFVTLDEEEITKKAREVKDKLWQ
ncbi:MAG: amidohydrolase [Actinobacteria bacterium]|nr:amidohydrolase [Actinomycetota bacterium]MCL5882870.1 amidohydrolase [Actinomycetota bacterium]